MSEVMRHLTSLPREQEATAAKSFHRTGSFVEFAEAEIEQSIPDRFEKMVRLHAERIAVTTASDSTRYAELNERANRIARAIVALCGEKPEPVALLLDNGVPMIAAVLGVLKAGKMYVPLDPGSAVFRDGYVLADSEPGVIVTNSRNFQWAESLAADKFQIINIDVLPGSLSHQNLGLPVAPDSLAYILYTSGSTGTPKGVVQNHRNVLHLIMRHTNSAWLCCEDRVALLRSFNVHGGTLQSFAGLLNGAAVLPYDVRSNGVRELARWLAAAEITVCRFGPTLFRHLIAELGEKARFPKLRAVSFSGEPLYKRDIESCREHFPADCRLVNSFGATEVSSCCEHPMLTDGGFADNRIPCGHAAPGMEIFLLNEKQERIESDEVGEIAVRSRYLALGYWRKPELTRAKFLPDPEGGDRRIYLTGDLGRVLKDGSLEHIGRKDFRTKLRDYTIEPAEIEAALMALDAVKHAVVVAKEDAANGRRLVAYLVPMNNGLGLTVSALRRALSRTLPEYMIPTTFISLDALPLTPNGKIDRGALPEPSTARPRLDTPYEAPTNLIEAEIERVWSAVLSVDRIGRRDNFLDLGGHSLAATRIISRLERTFNFEMPVQVVFQSPTIAELAAAIGERQRNKLAQRELEKILMDMESLSDDEAQSLLSNRTATHDSIRAKDNGPK